MADTFPSADTVATAIVAACKITGGDPLAVVGGAVSSGRAGFEVSRARAYAALALKEADFGCGSQAISRMVGTPKNSVSCYVGALEFRRQQGKMDWFDTDALAELVRFVRLSAKFDTSDASNPRPLVPVIVAKAAPEKPKERGRVFSLHGIKVDFTEYSETLFHAGKESAVSPRQALLFEALTNGMPNPIGRDFLRHRLFGPGGSMTHKDVQLDLVVSDAKHAARAVGLAINELKGIGYSLAVKP